MLVHTIVGWIIFIITVSYGHIFVYETENNEDIEKYDCVYYIHEFGQEIPYCRRPDETTTLQRSKTSCDNQGEKILFRHLIEKEIDPNSILELSSSIEMADMYARIFYDRTLMNDDNDDHFLCNCTKSGTFGKFCEYQLTHKKKAFSEAVTAQFKQKHEGDWWDTQRYGKILCYKTLPCLSSPLCLDWREICDGIQRCTDGIDEENWDLLEFNECEDNEFRCTNGMCIAEEFWLDGDYDCMDWSDEYYVNNGYWCLSEPNSLECDEHTCFKGQYSCGDGQCVQWVVRMAFQRFGAANDDCSSKRNVNYMCEVGHHLAAWTLEDGRCWPDRGYDDPRYPSWNMIHTTNLNNDEKCQYILRCILSRNFEHDCPCKNENCTRLMQNVCPLFDNLPLVLYPPQGLINSNMYIFYDYTQRILNSNVQYFMLYGSIKCRGYLYTAKVFMKLKMMYDIIVRPFINSYLCSNEVQVVGYVNYSSHLQMDKFCWNQSLTFNGRQYAVYPDICKSYGQCISQYRIRDGSSDCLRDHDETTSINENFCTGNVGRQRFQCFNDEKKCIPLLILGTTSGECSNRYDTSWYGNGTPASLRQEVPCWKSETQQCYRIKQYIIQSSNKNSTINPSLNITHQQESIKFVPFQSYCDTSWDLNEHVDEITSSCKHWTCRQDEYQCQTGQCIPVDWICDGVWDCADASDEEATVLIKTWSEHNKRLPNLFFQLIICQQLYSNASFSKICNTSFELGCYRSNVSDPLNITKNRPCINLTQIGDNIEDCYNAYDEKNTFIAISKEGSMWGFHFRCENGFHNSYTSACTELQRCTNILCRNDLTRKNRSCFLANDFTCLDEDYCRTSIRCNGRTECSNGEDEYWCPSGSLWNHNLYRSDKDRIILRQMLTFSFMWYPLAGMFQYMVQQKSNSTDDLQTKTLFRVDSYQCNRGVTVRQKNETVCLCPPAYYGHWCEFYSDRISIIVHFDQKSFNNISSNVTFKIRARFLLENQITVDYHDFDILPTLERITKIKHGFYLVYSRSRPLLEYKKWRYFNRTAVLNHHPYSVQFDVFILEINQHVQEFGAWNFPINFDYLPVFRLAYVLKLPFWLENATFNPCVQANCNENSTCIPRFNHNHSYYCSCRSGFYGTNCSMYEPLCETYCANKAFCIVNSDYLHMKNNKLHCICSLGYFGKHCHLKYNVCDSNSCLNNATCISYYNRTGEKPYECQCPWGFEGDRCEHEKISVRIRLNITQKLSVSAAVVQLYDHDYRYSSISIRYQRVYDALPSIFTYYDASPDAPLLAILKTYENSLSSPQYFILYILHTSVIDIISSPEHCPYALILLSNNIDFDPMVPAIFQYHKICRNHTDRLCFYDEYYLCICQRNHYRTDCFIHNPRTDHCDKCLSRGKCVQGNLEDINSFLCICPSCHHGYRCEFNLQAFGFTLDSLLVDFSTVVKIIYTSIACILFIIGLITNLCSFLTFIRPIPRKFGPGNYLLVLACFNQAALFCLLFKFIQITFVFINVVSCKSISYLLSVLTRASYWLTSWVTLERLLIILFPTSSILKSPRIAIKLTIITFIVLFVMHIHEIIYYTAIQHIPTGLQICVTNYDTIQISTYNRVSTLIHYLVPFVIQIICITILIFLISFSRKKTIKAKMTFSQVLIEQFQTQKELYVTPIIIIFSVLPQTIMTFSLVCSELTNWQRHVLLGAYLFSYAPQVLGFVLYVIPSSTYKAEFNATPLRQKYLKWMFRNEKKSKH